jgi:hypothetical protein
VSLCSSSSEAVAAFLAIHGKINGLGHINEGALCQEFLEGKEYVLDGVCRDGVYKVSRYMNSNNIRTYTYIA